MRHSGNYATMVNRAYLLNGIDIKLYIYDELDRFVTIGHLLLTVGDLQHMLNGISKKVQEHANAQDEPLPPWQ